MDTVDRPYPPLIDWLHHRIGTTHVAHHIDCTIPHYHAREATDAIAAAFPKAYLYDPVCTALVRGSEVKETLPVRHTPRRRGSALLFADKSARCTLPTDCAARLVCLDLADGH